MNRFITRATSSVAKTNLLAASDHAKPATLKYTKLYPQLAAMVDSWSAAGNLIGPGEDPAGLEDILMGWVTGADSQGNKYDKFSSSALKAADAELGSTSRAVMRSLFKKGKFYQKFPKSQKFVETMEMP